MSIEGTEDWQILYIRPDGWWSAGQGFKSEAEAIEAAENHDWGSAPWTNGATPWRVVPTGSEEVMS